MRIPIRLFEYYWPVWVIGTLAICILNICVFFIPLVFAFLIPEFMGILFTEKDAGTLTVILSTHIPEDFTFLILGLMLWRVSEWLPHPHLWMLWLLAAWLIQHFIRSYIKRRHIAPTS